MAHKIDDDEPAAAAAHILYQRHHLFVGQMMGETNTNCCISVRELHRRCIAGNDWHNGIGRRSKVHANHVHVQRRLKVCEHGAMTTPDVEHTPDDRTVPAEGARNRRARAQQAVREVELAVGERDDLGGQFAAIKEFDITASPHEVDVIGGGPAGAMAAIAARRHGALVRLFEKSRFPRHKVCGEFLSPAILEILTQTGCADAFLALQPARLRRMALHFGARVVRHRLPADGFGLSRSALDLLLLDAATSVGATLVQETHSPKSTDQTTVLAHGRGAVAQDSNRLFGFKAHFRGRVNDEVALYFFDQCYVGVSAVEGGAINVCGLAPERLLKACAFEPDRLLARCGALSERLTGWERCFEWLITGPLVTGWAPWNDAGLPIYPAGDALGFIDPFTGSGILNAMASGMQAGRAAATGMPVSAYMAERHRALRRPFLVSAVCRAALAADVGRHLASLVPGRWLFHLTRPSL